MAWYLIVAIVIGALFVVTFVTFITNADMKLVEKIYNKLMAYHDSKNIDENV